MKIEPLTIVDAVDGTPRFRFTRVTHDLVGIDMLDYGAWLIADPQYPRWLINYLLDNPYTHGKANSGYKFPLAPGEVDSETIIIYITHLDNAKLRAWLEEDHA